MIDYDVPYLFDIFVKNVVICSSLLLVGKKKRRPTEKNRSQRRPALWPTSSRASRKTWGPCGPTSAPRIEAKRLKLNFSRIEQLRVEKIHHDFV